MKSRLNHLLRECRDALAEPLAKLFQDCLQRSYHPMPFHHSKTVVLRKPQKPTYDAAKACRPTALLNTFGKVLEKIVARRVSALAVEHDLLSTTQMGVRPGRSTGSVMALEMLTEQIQTVWANDASLVASMLSLDLSGAFDKARVAKARQVYAVIVSLGARIRMSGMVSRLGMKGPTETD
jgi:hypothetical protein